jgi:hypothetical protein
MIANRVAPYACTGLAIGGGLAGCDGSNTALESARAACAATMQALYEPISDTEAVTIERVASTATESRKFEFIWRRGQISGLMWRLLPVQLDTAGPRGPNVTYELRGEPGETAYACRGSLTVRSIHAIWLLQPRASGPPTEIRLTKHPIAF